MDDKLIEAGEIVNTHGVHGEVKILPWADSPGFLTDFELLYIDGAPIKVLSARVQKNFVIAALDGVTDFNGAIKLKNKTVFIDRSSVQLAEGQFFIADILGIRAVNAQTGDELGIVADVLTLPANNVYVIKGMREILVPAVPDFVDEINIAEGFIKVRIIEGM